MYTHHFNIIPQKLELTEDQKDKSKSLDIQLPVKGKTDLLKSIIISKNKVNCLDDLSQLLNNSAKYQKALNLSRLGHFRDFDFQPNLQSLIGFRKPENINYYKSLTWLRPPIFFEDIQTLMLL